MRRALLATTLAVVFGCDSKPAPASKAPASVERRPFLLVLHGLGGSGVELSRGLGIDEHAKARRFSYAAPDGDYDDKGRRFWNAWNACCDFGGKKPNHVARLGKLIEDALKDPKVDPDRVWVLGFSNGGFMAHRLACELEGLSAIVSVAGVGPSEAEPCAPKKRVHVLQIHGDQDAVVSYGGGHTLGQGDLPEHASARSTVLRWAKLQGCGGRDAARVGVGDWVPTLPGDETLQERVPGCDRNIELWTVQGADHRGPLTRSMLQAVFDSLDSLGGARGG